MCVCSCSLLLFFNVWCIFVCCLMKSEMKPQGRNSRDNCQTDVLRVRLASRTSGREVCGCYLVAFTFTIWLFEFLFRWCRVIFFKSVAPSAHLHTIHIHSAKCARIYSEQRCLFTSCLRRSNRGPICAECIEREQCICSCYFQTFLVSSHWIPAVANILQGHGFHIILSVHFLEVLKWLLAWMMIYPCE